MFVPNIAYVFVCDRVRPVVILGCITLYLILFMV